MTVLGIVHPTNLLGQELRQVLEGPLTAADELRLLSDDETEVGTLTEIQGAATMVQRLGDRGLDEVEIAFFCGGIEASRPLLADLPEATTAIILSPDATAADGRPVVAGVNAASARSGEVLLSPHPGAVLLAHLLQAVLPFSPQAAVATLVQPASHLGKSGLDELFEQTRSILAFAQRRPEAVFGRQLAFNLYPPPAGAGGDLEAVVRQCLGRELPVAVQLLQGGVFHGMAASLHVQLEEDPGLRSLREALAAHPDLHLEAEGDLDPGPVDAANRPGVLASGVRPAGDAPGAYWIWAVMDNLTTGGALNAAAIAEAVLAGG